MRKFLRYLIILLLIGSITGYIFWQKNKKNIIKDTISSTLKKGTDSLYIINYDSSDIDEINGNVSFSNITLQADPIKKEFLKKQDSLPNVLYNINVKEIIATGVDVAGLLKKENLTAEKIVLNKPLIQITNTGADKPNPFTYTDTLELYKQILGRFKNIKAGQIQIINGTLIIADNKGKSLTTLENINIELNNFLIDSTRNYQNVISYFIKDVKVNVENIQLPESKNDTRINIGNFMYDAAKKVLHIATIQQYKTSGTQALIDLKNIQINQLNTDAFILNRELKAGLITCDGGTVTIYKNSKLAKNNRVIEFSSNTIDEAQIEGINLGSTKVIVINPSNPKQEALIINNVKFVASDVASVTEGITVSEMINSADWQLSAGNFSIATKDKLYRIIATDILIDNLKATAKIKNISVKPVLSEQAFVKNSRYQRDRFDISVNDIFLDKISFKKIIGENLIEIEKASLHPVIKILNDRTLPPDSNSKVGKYPHQLLLKTGIPININKMIIKNGSVAYKEKARKSQLTGTVFFSDINATITNFTNVPHKIKLNRICSVNATALFLGQAKLTTLWKLPLESGNGNFSIIGNLGSMNAISLNQIIEPLAMASVKEGKINTLDFNLTGDDYKASGDVLFLYNNLNVEILKKGSNNDLVTKDIISFFANALVKNDNPRRDETYQSNVNYQRDIYKSFFNLIWKSVFDGVKKTVLGKKF